MKNLNRYIDHTLLRADAKTAEIQNLCFEAIENNFYSVCVNTSFVALAKSTINNAYKENPSNPFTQGDETSEAFTDDTPVKVVATIGFPLGACSTQAKAFEADDALKNGADEIDMVMNIGAFKEHDYEYVAQDIATVVTIAQNYNATVKVIIETCLLTKDEIIAATDLAISVGADFVKTSTGFSTGGASYEDVKAMAEIIGSRGKIKASGGIRTREDAIKMLEAGASRIGCSNSVEIVSK